MNGRESFIFYRSFVEAISLLPDEGQRAELYTALAFYALDGVEPAMDGVSLAIFKLIKPQIDANNRKRIAGKMGGRPKPSDNQAITKNNQGITKDKPSNNQGITKAKPSENQTKPNVECIMNNVECRMKNANVNDNAGNRVLSLLQEDGAPATPATDGACGKPNAGEVLSMAREIGAKCHSMEDAEFYISCRERTGWKVNGHNVVNIRADIKAFFIARESNDRQRQQGRFDSKHPSQDFSKGFL